MEEQFIERERENIGKKKKKFSRGIIRLNNVADLIKIPINDLNSIDVNSFKGNLYKKIYEEALKEENNLIQKKNIESEETKSNMENLDKRNNLSSLYIMEQKKNSSNNIHLRDKNMKINLSSSSSGSEEKKEEKKEERKEENDFYEIKKTNTIYTSQRNKILNQYNFNINKSYKGPNLNYNNLNSTKKNNSDKNNANYNNNSVNKACNPYINNNSIYINSYSNKDRKSFNPINQRQNPQEKQIKNLNISNDNNNSSFRQLNISNSNINLRNNLSLGNSMLKKITFIINYTTTYGEEMGILGSLPILGNWDESKAFKLIWSNGHVWKGEIPVNNYIVKGFEFKFVIIQDKKVKTWENGENNKFDYDGFINEIKVNKKGFYSKYEYEYNAHNGELSFYCKWRY